jgi:hypothetical protein
MDSVLSIDQDLVVEALRTHALQTLQLYASGTTIKWNDAELAIYLIFIFGEINKSVLALCCVTAIEVLTWVRLNEGSIRFQPSTSSS